MPQPGSPLSSCGDMFVPSYVRKSMEMDRSLHWSGLDLAALDRDGDAAASTAHPASRHMPQPGSSLSSCGDMFVPSYVRKSMEMDRSLHWSGLDLAALDRDGDAATNTSGLPA
ncbi:hypothetical protein CYMTET_9829 [Cymbomonas tetramitiformis]|uniref:Uncharacterized protein n=1 Tax=Cymbomonas tetramitiformis TaxID=36881 RepID=A0AAE0GQS0_9CHLO|nr:hypothetical protein CYMTET_9829 [Cymbomonas tetramitiformis]